MSTIGVAVAIPEPWATQLQQQRAAFGDPQADAIPTHITLVPPTEIDGNLATVDEHLAKVASDQRPFRLRLRGTATFRPVSPVVFIVVTEGISACEVLAAAARSGPLAQELRFPYHPHVTVAHHLDEAALDLAYDSLADFDCAFEVAEFHLYLHGPDGVWRPHRTFPLGGSAD
ncbi:MAG TPA: 2'-5' RNA ligase family protein [Nocardioidaceae bacterium]